MSYKIVILPEAEDALLKEYIYLHNIEPKRADRVEKEFDRLIDVLQQYPFIFSIRYKNVRFAVMKNFRYNIHYAVRKKTVFITGLFHTSRDPKNWKV